MGAKSARRGRCTFDGSSRAGPSRTSSASNRGDPPRETPVGTTVRYYDEAIDAWHIVWLSPYQGVERAFVARRQGEEIVLQGTTPEGYPERWVFSDITPDSFRWHSEETHDHGATWLLTEESRMRRVTRRD